MTMVTRVIRNTPAQGLRKYFDWKGFHGVGADCDQGCGMRPATAMIKAVAHLGEEEQAVLVADFERIQEMTDEPGQSAILRVMADRAYQEEFCNPYDRAMWLYVNDQSAFRRAEEIRYTDDRRQGRMWSGFVGPLNLTTSREPADHRRFEERVRSIFSSRNTKMDVFERSRPDHNDRMSRLVQVVVYREGMPNAALAFDGCDLELHIHRPVYEVIVTYESATGVIEVVAQGTENRARLARLFAEVMLQQGIFGLRLPLRQYDLTRLLTPFDFPTDPEDGIHSVKVVVLDVSHHHLPDGHLVLKTNRRKKATVYDIADQCLVGVDDMAGHYHAFEAILSIKFLPNRNAKRGQILNVRIVTPNGCDLKSTTERARLVCAKYLPRWGLMKDVNS